MNPKKMLPKTKIGNNTFEEGKPLKNLNSANGKVRIKIIPNARDHVNRFIGSAIIQISSQSNKKKDSSKRSRENNRYWSQTTDPISAAKSKKK
jgi:hypothetical protein